MKETVQQYMKRILGYVGEQKPLAVQAATPAKMARLIRGVPRRKLSRRPGRGKWSVGEIVAHLAETEMVGGYRIRMILSANGTPIQAFDQDKWAVAGSYRRRDPRQSFQLFRAIRAGNLALLDSLRPAQWKQYGLHAERGKETVAKIVRMFAGHDLNHLLQIKRILKK
jgi:hypothetical protein